MDASKARLGNLEADELSATGDVTLIEHERMRNTVKSSLHKMMIVQLLRSLQQGLRSPAVEIPSLGLSEEGRDG